MGLYLLWHNNAGCQFSNFAAVNEIYAHYIKVVRARNFTRKCRNAEICWNMLYCCIFYVPTRSISATKLFPWNPIFFLCALYLELYCRFGYQTTNFWLRVFCQNCKICRMFLSGWKLFKEEVCIHNINRDLVLSVFGYKAFFEDIFFHTK